MDYEFKLYGLLDGNEGREDDEYNNARTLNEQKLSSLIKKHHLTVEKDTKLRIVTNIKYSCFT